MRRRLVNFHIRPIQTFPHLWNSTLLGLQTCLSWLSWSWWILSFNLLSLLTIKRALKQNIIRFKNTLYKIVVLLYFWQGYSCLKFNYKEKSLRLLKLNAHSSVDFNHIEWLISRIWVFMLWYSLAWCFWLSSKCRMPCSENKKMWIYSRTAVAVLDLLKHAMHVNSQLAAKFLHLGLVGEQHIFPDFPSLGVFECRDIPFI